MKMEESTRYFSTLGIYNKNYNNNYNNYNKNKK